GVSCGRIRCVRPRAARAAGVDHSHAQALAAFVHNAPSQQGQEGEGERQEQEERQKGQKTLAIESVTPPILSLWREAATNTSNARCEAGSSKPLPQGTMAEGQSVRRPWFPSPSRP